MKDQLVNILACPDCKTKVQRVDDGRALVCSHCQRQFYFHGEVPVLFSKNSENTKNSGEIHYTEEKGSGRLNLTRRIAQALSDISNIPVGRTLHDELRDTNILNAPQNSLILNLGSGVETMILRDNIINFDIYPHKNTNACGDGHYLPFMSNSFSGVWLCAVLEHLSNPFQVAAEVYRVLEPGGFVLVSAPFMYHIHGVPHDYFRYTDDGLRAVFKRFKEVECGRNHTLPTGTLIEIISQYASLFIEHKTLSLAVRLFVKLLLQPFKPIDYYLRRSSRAKNLSGGFCFLGIKEH